MKEFTFITYRTLKILLCITFALILLFSLSSCEKEGTTNEEYYGDYHDGYVDGYSDGALEAQRQISGYVDECFNSIGYDNRIGEAIQILTNYADGEPTSEEELHKAIWAIDRYYSDIRDIVYDIDEISID